METADTDDVSMMCDAVLLIPEIKGNSNVGVICMQVIPHVGVIQGSYLM